MFREKCPKCGKRMKRAFVYSDLFAKISKWECKKCGYSVVYADSFEYNSNALVAAWCGIGINWVGAALYYLRLPTAVWMPPWIIGLIIAVVGFLRFKRKLRRQINPDSEVKA